MSNRPRLIQEGKPIIPEKRHAKSQQHHSDDNHVVSSTSSATDHNNYHNYYYSHILPHNEVFQNDNNQSAPNILATNNSNNNIDDDYQRQMIFLEQEYQKAIHRQQANDDAATEASKKSSLATHNNTTIKKKLTTYFQVGAPNHTHTCNTGNPPDAFSHRDMSHHTHHRLAETMDMDMDQNHQNTFHTQNLVHEYHNNHNHNHNNIHLDNNNYHDTITNTNNNNENIRMEIDDILPKPPLIVIDGANVAYAYSNCLPQHQSSNTTCLPDVQGILIAVSYFLHASCRVQVVLPTHWIRAKTNTTGNSNNNNAGINSKNRQKPLNYDLLQQLEYQNILCCSPPTDDDDAYAIAMARREDSRAKRRKEERQQHSIYIAASSSPSKNLNYHHDPKGGQNLSSLQAHASPFSTTHNIHENCNTLSELSSMDGAYVLSNDLFRDAIARDSRGMLRDWLVDGSQTNSNGIPGRISYSFCDLGSIDKYGDPMLDFLPNPRHLVIDLIEQKIHQHG